jgi:heme o synthase
LKATVEVKKAPLELGMLRVWDYVELFKMRIALLVLVTTSVGYYLGMQGQAPRLDVLFHTLLGTAIVAAAGCAFNQLIERNADGRMRRTAGRPLPSGRMQPGEVQWMATAMAVGSVAYLALSVSPLCSLVAAVTLVSYSFVYTPLKKKTPLAVLVGAVPGALPPMIGWVAARGELGGHGWILFGIMFLWQIPHFLAIAWMYRSDYARGGFPVLAVLDPDGRRTGRQAVLYSLVLIPVSLLPSLWGIAGAVYLGGALVLGIAYLLSSVWMALGRSDLQARWVFRVSLLYLPLLLCLMICDLTTV